MVEMSWDILILQWLNFGVFGHQDTPESMVIFCGYVTDCMQTPDGRNYTGKRNKAENKLPCYSWEELDTKYKIVKWRGNEFPDGSAAAAKDYCRNPNHPKFNQGLNFLVASEVWCITVVHNPILYNHTRCDVNLCGQYICISGSGMCNSRLMFNKCRYSSEIAVQYSTCPSPIFILHNTFKITTPLVDASYCQWYAVIVFAIRWLSLSSVIPLC